MFVAFFLSDPTPVPVIGDSLTGASDAFWSQIVSVLPVALPIAIGIIGLLVGWRLFKRFVRG